MIMQSKVLFKLSWATKFIGEVWWCRYGLGYIWTLEPHLCAPLHLAREVDRGGDWYDQTLKQNETRISENRLIASIFASMMTNFYGNLNNLFTFTFDFDSQLRLSRLYIQNSILDEWISWAAAFITDWSCRNYQQPKIWKTNISKRAM